MLHPLSWLLPSICFWLHLTVFGASIDIARLLNRTDDLYRSRSSHALITMEIVTPDWQRTLELEAWSQGTENTLIRILKPAKERGIATLKIKQDMWNYFPKINQVIKVPSSMMMGSWMGSDFTNDDLVREYRYTDDYSYTSEEQAPTIIVTLIPKENTISLWGKIVLTIDKATELPQSQVFYDEKNRRIRKLVFSDIRSVGDQQIPHQLQLESVAKPGHKTVVRYTQLQLNLPLDDSIFNRQNLQKRM